MKIAINGTLDITFYDVNKNEVSKEKETEILGKLKESEYVIGLATKTLVHLPSMEVIGTFEFEVEDDTEYNFFEEEDFG